MAKSKDIINQLLSILPILTDKFSDTLVVSSLTRSGSTATVTTAGTHGLTTNDLVHISGALSPLVVDSLTILDDIVTGITFEDHDLTLGFQEDITIEGANEAGYNGTFKLLSVPNRKTFTYDNLGTPVSSPATGSIVVFDGKDRGYNGLFVVTSVPTTTTFTYTLVGTPISPARGDVLAKKNFRISGGVTLDRLTQAYSPQQSPNRLWLFVVPNRAFSTKVRQFDNDATYTPAHGDAYRQQIIEQYILYVFFPTVDEIAARFTTDEAQDIRTLIFKAILGVKFPFNLNEEDKYLMAYVEDGLAEYVGSYYVHQYVFEISAYINSRDIVDPSNEVAFREIDLTLKQETPDDLSPELTVDIDLDNEPL